MANNTLQFNDFNIPVGGYVAFDATSLRQLIINRLNEQGVFTDQNFVGSNLAAIIDIIAYSYNTLIYYLNKTSTESMFSEAQLYENINRIVKLIDYSPVGNQTSTLTFNCSAQGLTQGTYTIPLYTYVVANNLSFSFNSNTTFAKTTNNTVESLDNLSNNALLHQGQYVESPVYVAAGNSNEVVTLNPGNDIADHFNIDVYVKPLATGVWQKFTSTPNLFLENGTATKYQIRLNENKYYEITFGNNINGIQLQTGDQVAVYYLASNGVNGVVGPNTLNNNSQLVVYNTLQYNQIINDVYGGQYNYITSNTTNTLSFANANNSTPFNTAETVASIRNNAPSNYRSQNRLVTTSDYISFVKTNFANLITDAYCVNNTDYIAGYMQYYYNIGITNPQITDRALFNQVTFSDSCNFNNIYLIVVPKSNAYVPNYLLPAQKQFIRSSIGTSKVATTETVFVDPIYKAISLGVTSSPTTFNPSTESGVCVLNIKKTTSSLRSNQAIINDVVNVFTTYFKTNNITLGQTLDVRSLNQQIYSIDGIQTFYTSRTDDPAVSIEGLSLFVWNPLYPTLDKTSTTSNVAFNYFEYCYFNNINNLVNNINIIGS
jgi:hypothetical protein